MRDSFVFYKSFYDAISELEPESKFRLFDAICAYAYEDTEPTLKGAEMAIFRLIQPQIDANNRKYESGKKGGAPSGNQNASKNDKNNLKQPKTTKNKQKQRNVNVNVNDNVNVNVNDNVSAKTADEMSGGAPDASTCTLLVVNALNDRTGRRFQVTGATTNLVSALLDRGYTVEDIIKVINRKCDEWLAVDKMRTFCRPSTLLQPDKFDEYLNQAPTVAEEKAEEREKRREQAQTDVGLLERELDQLTSQYLSEKDIKQRIDIKGNIAVVEAKLESARAVAGV